MTSFAVLLTAGVLLNALYSEGGGQADAADESLPASVEATSVQTTVSEVETDSATSSTDQTAEPDEPQSTTETRERSMVLELSSTAESSSEDGETSDVKIRGKILVIGPDGEKWEYNLDDSQTQNLRKKFSADPEKLKSEKIVIIHKDSPDNDETKSDKDHSSEPTWVEERFVIGIQCEEASELLRVHLRLGEKGVVILDVRDETPAATGGLQKHDIIVSIDGDDVVSRDDLTKAVVESDGKPLVLSIIRAGELQSITVTPTKMKVPVVVAPATTDAEQLRVLAGSGKGGVRLQLVHPGIMLEGVLPQDEKSFKSMIEQFRRSAGQKAAKTLEEARLAREEAGQIKGHTENRDDELHERVRTLQREMQEMQKQLVELKKQLKPEDEN